MNKKQNSVYRLSMTAVMTALYFVLTTYGSIRLGNIRITVASLPIILLAALFGPAESCAAAGLGEFLNQVLTYGLTPTTPVWLLPPMLRALVIALGCRAIVHRKPGKPAWSMTAIYSIVLVIAAIMTTLANTAVTYFDSKLFHYYSFAYVFGDFGIRFMTGIITAIVLSIVSVPVLNAISRLPGCAPYTGRKGDR